MSEVQTEAATLLAGLGEVPLSEKIKSLCGLVRPLTVRWEHLFQVRPSTKFAAGFGLFAKVDLSDVKIPCSGQLHMESCRTRSANVQCVQLIPRGHACACFYAMDESSPAYWVNDWKGIGAGPNCEIRDFTDGLDYENAFRGASKETEFVWLQVPATKTVKAGEEILAEYGNQYSFFTNKKRKYCNSLCTCRARPARSSGSLRPRPSARVRKTKYAEVGSVIEGWSRTSLFGVTVSISFQGVSGEAHLIPAMRFTRDDKKMLIVDHTTIICTLYGVVYSVLGCGICTFLRTSTRAFKRCAFGVEDKEGRLAVIPWTSIDFEKSVHGANQTNNKAWEAVVKYSTTPQAVTIVDGEAKKRPAKPTKPTKSTKPIKPRRRNVLTTRRRKLPKLMDEDSETETDESPPSRKRVRHRPTTEPKPKEQEPTIAELLEELREARERIQRLESSQMKPPSTEQPLSSTTAPPTSSTGPPRPPTMEPQLPSHVSTQSPPLFYPASPAATFEYKRRVQPPQGLSWAPAEGYDRTPRVPQNYRHSPYPTPQVAYYPYPEYNPPYYQPQPLAPPTPRPPQPHQQRRPQSQDPSTPSTVQALMPSNVREISELPAWLRQITEMQREVGHGNVFLLLK